MTEPKNRTLAAITGAISTQTEDATMSHWRRLENGDPILGYIGEVAYEWAHLEHILDTIIWKMAGVEPPKGACLTAQIMGVAPRYRTIISLAKLLGLPEKVVKQANKLMSETYDVSEHRNRIVHDPWYFADVARWAQFRSMPSKNPTYGFEDINVNDILQAIVRIRACAEKAASLRGEISHILSTSL